MTTVINALKSAAKAVMVACSVAGCGRTVEETRALVPAISFLTNGGVPLAKIDLAAHVLCPQCARQIRHAVPGAEMFSLLGTRVQITRRLAERADRKEREAGIKAAAEKFRAQQRPVKKASCGACGRPALVTKSDPAGAHKRVCLPCFSLRGGDGKAAETAFRARWDKQRPADDGRAVDVYGEYAAEKAAGNGHFRQTVLPVVEVKTTGKDGRKLAGAPAHAQVAKAVTAVVTAQDEAVIRARKAKAERAAAETARKAMLAARNDAMTLAALGRAS